MLNKLIIKNIALIDSAEINFTKGLNVLSGETGSGKSVIIESLNFVLGAKADKTLIRTGENACLVRAEFNVSDNEKIYEIYDEFDFDRDDDLIISRKFTTDGKSSIKVNGNTVTVGMLRKFTSLLVDIHGQSEHFNLLKLSNQLSLIDKFGSEKIAEIKSQLNDSYAKYKKIKIDLESVGGDESQRLIRQDILTYQINEIKNANLVNGEEEELLSVREKINNQEKIVNTLNAVKSTIGEEGGVSDMLGNISRMMASISGMSNDYSDLSQRLDSSFSEIDDISVCADSLLSELDMSQYNPYEIEDRLDLIKSLKSKYGSTYDDIMKFLSDAETEKEKLDNFAEYADKLLKDKKILEDKIYDLYVRLSNERRKSANIFTRNILEELKELGMNKACFEVAFSDIVSRENCVFDSSNGFDKIEFMFSANAGEPVKPLSYVISGGEMSRFMLSIKAQTAKYNDVSTFIFDEIDAGISGAIAKIVAEKFIKISENVQVIAITHLPQISVMADNNLLISKIDEKGKTNTYVKSLTEEEKVNEIIRLIGGEVSSESARKHAEDLIDNAVNFKKNILNK